MSVVNFNLIKSIVWKRHCQQHYLTRFRSYSEWPIIQFGHVDFSDFSAIIGTLWHFSGVFTAFCEIMIRQLPTVCPGFECKQPRKKTWSFYETRKNRLETLWALKVVALNQYLNVIPCEYSIWFQNVSVMENTQKLSLDTNRTCKAQQWAIDNMYGKEEAKEPRIN